MWSYSLQKALLRNAARSLHRCPWCCLCRLLYSALQQPSVASLAEAGAVEAAVEADVAEAEAAGAVVAGVVGSGVAEGAGAGAAAGIKLATL
jgi:hypothetical protein